MKCCKDYITNSSILWHNYTVQNDVDITTSIPNCDGTIILPALVIYIEYKFVSNALLSLCTQKK